MKILALGDVHLRDTNPKWRTDNFSDSLFKKLVWSLEKGRIEECEVVIIPGDLFHTPRASNSVTRKFISLLKKYDDVFEFLAVAGNHDIHHYNKNLDNTPLGVVESSGLVKILSEKAQARNDVHFYGASWEEEIPTPIVATAFNVLATHKMIIKDDKLYPGQENYTTARTMLAKNSFDLIVSGDNHQSFISTYKGKTLLNMGSLMRSTAAELNHKPKITIFDTETKEYGIHEIPVENSESVFNLTEIEKVKKYKEENEKIKEYIGILGGEKETKEWDFVGNLNMFVKENGIDENVQKIIKSTLE